MIDLSLLPDFIAEAVEHLEEMETNLLQLEEKPGNLEILNDIFRSVHTIKGASEYMGMLKIAELSHKLESLMDMLRKGEKTLNKEIIDALIESRDLISILISELEQSQTEETDTASMIERIELLSSKTLTEDETYLSDDVSLMESESETNAKDDDFETSIEKALNDVMDDITPSTDAQDESEDEPDTALADEISDDDIGDPELFDIFTNQLNDSFYKIQAHLNNPPLSDDINATLNQLTQIIRALRSSANYMGYDKLTLFYEKWITDIRQTQDQFAQTGKSSWSDIIRKYMKPYINKIVRLFPQLGKFWISTQWLEEMDAREKEEDVQTFKADDTQSFEDVLSAEEIEHIIETTDSDKISDIIEPVAAVESEKPAEAEIVKPEEEVVMVEADETPSVADTLSTEEIEHGIETVDSDKTSDIIEPVAAVESEKPDEAEIVEPEKEVVMVKADETPSVADTLSTEEIEHIIETTDSDKTSNRIKPDAVVEIKEADGDNIRAEIAEPEQTIGMVKDKDAVMPPSQEEQVLFDKLASAYDYYPKDTIHTTGDSNDMIDANLFSTNDLTPEGRPVVKDFLFSTLAGEKTIKDEKVPPVDTPETASVSETRKPETITMQETVIPDEASEVPFVSEEDAKPEYIAPAKEVQVPLMVAEPAEKDTTIKKQQTREKRYSSSVIKKSVRVDALKIDALMNQVGELVVSRAWFSQLYNEMRELQQYLKESSRLEQKEMKQVRAITFRLSEATVNLGRVATELQEGVMRVRMLPISQLFNRYPRLVRDLIHDTPKKINLEIRGEDTELDKMIIEKISDPLIHIIRNAADHGIESPEERRRAGKPETGRIILEAFHESNHVVIEVRDDGQGLDPEKIKAVAISRKFINQEEKEYRKIEWYVGDRI